MMYSRVVAPSIARLFRNGITEAEVLDKDNRIIYTTKPTFEPIALGINLVISCPMNPAIKTILVKTGEEVFIEIDNIEIPLTPCDVFVLVQPIYFNSGA